MKLPQVSLRYDQKVDKYFLDYRNSEGRRRRLRVGASQDEAERKRIWALNLLMSGKDPEREMERAKRKEEEQSITLSEFFGEFMQRHGTLQSRNTQRLYQICLDNIGRTELGGFPLRDIRTKYLEDYRNLRMELDGVTPATVNRECALIRNMLNRAVAWDRLDRNPLRGYKQLHEKNRRDPSNITMEQIGALLNELPSPISEIAELSILTGLRKDEVLDLRIESLVLDINQGWTLKVKGKGSKWRTVPLCVQAVDLLERVKGDKTEGWIFVSRRTGNRYVSIHKTFDRAVRKLGLCIVGGQKLQFHDLRRLFGHWFMQRGGSLDALREIFAHADRATTDRYARLQVGGGFSMPDFRKKEAPEVAASEAK